MLTPAEVRVLDGNAAALGVPVARLMENAGRAVAGWVLDSRWWTKKSRALVLAGAGNNGGDGYVAARHLAARAPGRVRVLPLVPPKSDLARAMGGKVRALVVRAGPAEGTDAREGWFFDQLSGHQLVLDALLGIGATGELREPFARACAAVNGVRAEGVKVVSVDVPSGLGTPGAVRPDVTVTFHDVKEGMTSQNSGEIVVRDIGIPEDAHRFTGPGELSYLPEPHPHARKGQRGTVLVIGGGPYHGAPQLTAQGASRCGVDLVYLAVPESVAPAAMAFGPTGIVRPLPGDHLAPNHVGTLLALAKDASAVAIGPGLGKAGDTLQAILALVARLTVPIVVDADAHTALATDPGVIRGKRAVCTPHAGEFRRLTGKESAPDVEERAALVQGEAKRLGVTLLLKGPVDVISDGEEVRRNRTGNVAMVVGGTGDVLTGIVAAMLAKGIPPFPAARIGAYLAGRAGDIAFERLGHSLDALDVVNGIPDALAADVPWWRPGRAPAGERSRGR